MRLSGLRASILARSCAALTPGPGRQCLYRPTRVISDPLQPAELEALLGGLDKAKSRAGLGSPSETGKREMYREMIEVNITTVQSS